MDRFRNGNRYEVVKHATHTMFFFKTAVTAHAAVFLALAKHYLDMVRVGVRGKGLGTARLLLLVSKP